MKIPLKLALEFGLPPRSCAFEFLGQVLHVRRIVRLRGRRRVESDLAALQPAFTECKVLTTQLQKRS